MNGSVIKEKNYNWKCPEHAKSLPSYMFNYFVLIVNNLILYVLNKIKYYRLHNLLINLSKIEVISLNTVYILIWEIISCLGVNYVPTSAYYLHVY